MATRAQSAQLTLLGDDEAGPTLSDKDVAERNRNWELIRDCAEKNQCKLDKKLKKGVCAGDCAPEERELGARERASSAQRRAECVFGFKPLSKEQ